MVGAADDVGDAGVEVVDDDGEVVDGRAVGAGDHEVVLQGVLELALAADDVADDGDALVGDAQAHRALALVRRRGSPRLPCSALQALTSSGPAVER